MRHIQQASHPAPHSSGNRSMQVGSARLRGIGGLQRRRRRKRPDGQWNAETPKSLPEPHNRPLRQGYATRGTFRCRERTYVTHIFETKQAVIYILRWRRSFLGADVTIHRSERALRRKSLHRQTPGPKLGREAGVPLGRAVRSAAAEKAEIRPNEPGRASPVKGVRDYRSEYRSVVSPENHHRRRRGDGARHCMASRTSRLPGDCV